MGLIYAKGSDDAVSRWIRQVSPGGTAQLVALGGAGLVAGAGITATGYLSKLSGGIKKMGAYDYLDEVFFGGALPGGADFGGEGGAGGRGLSTVTDYLVADRPKRRSYKSRYIPKTITTKAINRLAARNKEYKKAYTTLGKIPGIKPRTSSRRSSCGCKK